MGAVLPAAKRVSAIRAAASLIWPNMERQISDPLAPAARIIQAIRPIYGIAWNRAVVMQLKTENMNPVFCKLRNSLLPRPEYDRLANFAKEAFSALGSIPP